MGKSIPLEWIGTFAEINVVYANHWALKQGGKRRGREKVGLTERLESEMRKTM